MSDIYKRGAKKKIRFETSKGNIGIEDLWDMPLESANGDSLDSLAVGYDKKLKEETKSFVKSKSVANTLVQLKFDIVCDVIETKIEENKTKLARAEKAEKRKVILAAIARKESSEIDDASKDELNKMLKELEELED